MLNFTINICVFLISYTCQESLREVESGYPEARRIIVVIPLLQEVESLNQINKVTAQRLQRRIRDLSPHLRHLTNLQAIRQILQVLIHDHEAFDSFLQVLEASSDHLGQLVVALHLLHEHSVHTFIIRGRISQQGLLKIEISRQLAQYIVTDLHELGIAVATGRSNGAQCKDDTVKEEFGRLNVLGDIHVVVHAEHLGVLSERQCLCHELFVNNHYLNLYSNLQHYYIIDI